MTAPDTVSFVLRGGHVIDGTGRPAIRADVAIQSGRIVGVGENLILPGATEMDVSGRIVAPGFIDVHTHDDLACIAEPEMVAKISQGVTTVVVGNCGISATIVFDGAASEPFNLLGESSHFRFPAFADYAVAVDTASPRVNVGALVGHSTLRVRCVGDLERPADAAERARMEAMLATALRDGALGLSSGVFYAPAAAADATELAGLARVVAAAGGIYTAHIRDEYDGVAEALTEAFDVSRDGRVPLVISHHKCAGVKNWGRSGETLDLIDRARAGQSVHLDCYPYAAGSTVLREDLADGQIDVLVNWSTPFPDVAGRRLHDIAADWCCSQSEAARRLSPGGATYFQMREDDVRAIITHEACMIGSDGLPTDPLPHPRLWGTFPRVLGHYVRDLGLMTLEEAVRRMTGLSAEVFGLGDRGRIAPGLVADITVFDAATIADVATYERPQEMSAGIDHVFVNGSLSWSHGGPVGERTGRFVARDDSIPA